MRLLPNYFKTLGEGPARGMERGEKDAHEVYRITQSTLTSQSTSTEFRPLLPHSLTLSLSLSLPLRVCEEGPLDERESVNSICTSIYIIMLKTLTTK